MYVQFEKNLPFNSVSSAFKGMPFGIDLIDSSIAWLLFVRMHVPMYCVAYHYSCRLIETLRFWIIDPTGHVCPLFSDNLCIML